MPSESERESVAEKLDRHAEDEAKILEEYRALAERLGESPLSFLVDHILTEEELHHFLLISMAQWLRKPPPQAEPPLPEGSMRDDLLRSTRRLQEHERETIEACRSLKARLAQQPGELLGSLLDAMALDSEKHHRLLVAVEKMIEG